MNKSGTTSFVFLSFALLFLGTVAFIALRFQFPSLPYSTVIYADEGQLLGAKIAEDEQWRFPVPDSIPYKFKQCLIQFEDRHFYRHPGVNPFAILRALRQDISAGKIVSGGSTLTMQLVRLYRKNDKRTFWAKFQEMFIALAIELKYSKGEILRRYAANAPFGGNTVGLTAAAYRYFGRSPDQLSWAESACLAVLPNAPSLIYPGKGHSRLEAKRNRLLHRLLLSKIIDSTTYTLALSEPVPPAPKPLPKLAYHLLQRLHNTYGGKQLHTNINYFKQKKLRLLARDYLQKLQANKIYNLAILVVETESGKVRCYTGNSPVDKPSRNPYSYAVDLITAKRSSGSVLKPFLYAAMLDEGSILPRQLVADIPTRIGSFTPQNFSLHYEGAVPAGEALARSLNVPAVRLLKKYRYQRFYELLKTYHFNTLTKPADHYGLSIILGGAEVRLWDLVKAYSYWGRSLITFGQTRQYDKNGLFEPLLLRTDRKAPDLLSTEPVINSCAAIWNTLEAMREVVRPAEETGWKYFSGTGNIAWKTGTSYGFRDAWAVGVSPQYTVGIWIGNADGEGRNGMTGTSYAAPLMFEVFNALSNKGEWFTKPVAELTEVASCQESGFPAGPYCDHIRTVEIGKNNTFSVLCPYHHKIHLDAGGNYQVNATCVSPSEMKTENRFVLPPVMAHYYRHYHPEYRELPPYREDCVKDEKQIMQFIYPENNATFYIPKGFDRLREEIILQLSHARPATKVYWHLDGEYLGFTRKTHKFAINPAFGEHKISVIDEMGNALSLTIHILNR